MLSTMFGVGERERSDMSTCMYGHVPIPSMRQGKSACSEGQKMHIIKNWTNFNRVHTQIGDCVSELKVNSVLERERLYMCVQALVCCTVER